MYQGVSAWIASGLERALHPEAKASTLAREEAEILIELCKLPDAYAGWLTLLFGMLYFISLHVCTNRGCVITKLVNPSMCCP